MLIFSADQQEFFKHWGYLHIPNALPKQTIRPIQVDILKQLKQQNIWSSGKTLSKNIKSLPIFQQTAKLATILTLPANNQTLLPPSMTDALSQLSPQKTTFIAQNSQLLISLSHQGPWRLHLLNWHTDMNTTQKERTGIQVFVLLDDVMPRAGGTLALAGSHHYSGRHDLRQEIFTIARSDLATYSLPSSLALVEMHGKAGDMYVMDMRVLHSPAINESQNIRMMATVRFLEEIRS